MKILAKYLGILFLLSLAGASGWLVYKTIFIKPSFAARPQTAPSAILSHVTALNYAEDGGIKSQLTTERLVRYERLKKSELLNPVIIVNHPGQEPWHITADQGISLNDNQTVKLIGNVKLKQNGRGTNPDTLILTRELTFYPDTHIAKTQAPVTYTQIGADKNKITVTSVGAVVNQKTGQVHLLSQARGVYEPNH